MMWYWGSGGGWAMWIAGALMMLLFWGGMAALVVFLVRSFSGPRGSSGDTALEVLRRRLAAGEITTDEYERIRKTLQG